MKYALRSIMYENGDHWVLRTNKGTFEVYKNGITHSVRCGVIGFEGQKGLDKAKAECDRREEKHRVKNP